MSGSVWPIAHQVPLPRGFFRQEHWCGLACPAPGDLPDPGIEPRFLMPPVLVGGLFTTSATWEAPYNHIPNDKHKNCCVYYGS